MTVMEAPQPAQGATNEPIWRSMDPTQRVQSLTPDSNWFASCVALVKVSFGERGSTFGIFQNKIQENAYF